MNIFDSVTGVKQIKNYSSLLEGYKRVLEKYQKKVDMVLVPKEDKGAAVQTAQDVTELKTEIKMIQSNQNQLLEELACLEENLQAITKNQTQMEEKYERIDSLIIEPIKKNYTANKVAVNEQLDEVMNVTKKKSKGLKRLMIFSVVLHLICMTGISVVVLYLLDIIKF